MRTSHRLENMEDSQWFHMNRMGIIAAGTVLLALSTPAYVRAQEQESLKRPWWVSSYTGASLANMMPGGAGLSFNRGRRVLYQLGTGILIYDENASLANLRITNASLGIAHIRRLYLLSVFGGAAVVRDCAFSDTRPTCRGISAGAAVNVQAIFLPVGRYLGIGIDLLGVVSPFGGVVSIRAAFSFGNM